MAIFIQLKARRESSVLVERGAKIMPICLMLPEKPLNMGIGSLILPNPRETRTADFIFEKKRTYRMYDLKTAFGKASIGQNLLDSIGQCNRVLINMTTGYKTRSLAFAIKKYFEVNSKAVEVLIFKGRKRISIDRFIATNDDFFSIFKKSYER